MTRETILSSIGCADPEASKHISKLTDDQVKYIESSSLAHAFLQACPGSGKTEVVAVKAAYERARWNAHREGMAILSFTNNAVEEISTRVGKVSGMPLSYPHVVSTVDTWLSNYLVQPFGMFEIRSDDYEPHGCLRFVDANATGNWLHAFQVSIPYYSLKKDSLKPTPLFAHKIRRSQTIPDGWEISLPSTWVADIDYCESQAFQNAQKQRPSLSLEALRSAFHDAKKRFWQAGFLTYEDMRDFAVRLVNLSQGRLAQLLAKRFPFIIIDECQDLSSTYLNVFRRLVECGARVHLIGDLDQSIYSFIKAEPAEVERFVEDYGMNRLRLCDNFRSTPAIASFCGDLVGGKAIAGLQKSRVQHECVLFGYSESSIAYLPLEFSEYLAENGLEPSKSVILVRGRSTIQKVRGETADVDGPVAWLAKALCAWQSAQRSLALHWCGRFVAHVLFPERRLDSGRSFFPVDREHFVSERDYFLSTPASWRAYLVRVIYNALANDNVQKFATATWSDWARTVRDSVGGLLMRDGVLLKNGKAPVGLGRVRLSSTLAVGSNSKKDSICIKTIHEAKGESFDAVLLVSSARLGSGGHWREWLSREGRDGGEHSRFAYVASSRPRYLLGWAVPDTDGDAEDFVELSRRFSRRAETIEKSTLG